MGDADKNRFSAANKIIFFSFGGLSSATVECCTQMKAARRKTCPPSYGTPDFLRQTRFFLLEALEYCLLLLFLLLLLLLFLLLLLLLRLRPKLVHGKSRRYWDRRRQFEEWRLRHCFLVVRFVAVVEGSMPTHSSEEKDKTCALLMYQKRL